MSIVCAFWVRFLTTGATRRSALSTAWAKERHVSGSTGNNSLGQHPSKISSMRGSLLQLRQQRIAVALGMCQRMCCCVYVVGNSGFYGKLFGCVVVRTKGVWLTTEGPRNTSNGFLGECQLRSIHHRVLSAGFDQAWRENVFRSPSSINHLASARRFRDRAFWQTAQTVPESQRRAQGVVHAGMGYRTEWEDVLCTAFGAQWRAIRDSCADSSAWRALFPGFLTTVCSEWGLPAPRPPEDPERVQQPRSKRAKRTKHDLDERPSEHGEVYEPVTFWQQSNCFTFVVDCKPLADIMSGHVPLKKPGMLPVFERMTSNIFDFSVSGWTPHSRTADPVVWHRREKNLIADFLVNHTMDIGNSWHRDLPSPLSSFSPHDANFICHSDGGTRGTTCSGAAWILEAVFDHDQHRHTFIVAMRGIFIASPVAAFTAESIALDDAVSYLHSTVFRFHNTKRSRAT